MQEETLARNLVKHNRVLRGMLMAMVGDFHATEDLLQEIAVVMTRRREETAEDCAFLPWARSIALNVVRDYRKKKARRRVVLMNDEALESVARVFEEVEEPIWDLRRQALEKCAGKLPERERTLLRLRYEEKTPVERLAASFAMSRGAVDTMLYRIRKNLFECVQGRLREMGVS